MKKLSFLLTLLCAPAVWAESLDARKLYFGAGFGNASVAQASESPTALQYFVGYPLQRPHGLEDAPRFRLDLEVGYVDVSDYELDSYWVAPALSYRLNSELELLLRLGVEGGDSEGGMGAFGVVYTVSPGLAARLELLERSGAPVTFLNLVYRP